MKYMILVFFVYSGFYVIFPYVNGFGCDFKFSLESEHVKEVGKCKAGIFTSYSHNSVTGSSTYNRYVYGVDRDHVYFYNLSGGEKANGHSNTFLNRVDYKHAITFYDGEHLYVAKYKCLNKMDKMECHLIISEDIENVYKFNVDGRMSILY